MANVNGAVGFRAVRHQTGGMIRLTEYTIASAYGTAIRSGDPVELTGTGKNIQLAAAENTDNLGVFGGCRYVDPQGNQHFSRMWPAGQVATEIVAMVYDDPDIVFEIQCDSLAEGDVGQLMDWNAGSGSDLTGLSGAYAENSTKGTTGKALAIIGLVKRVDNAYGNYAKAEVIFAEHIRARVVSGVGGI